MRRYSGGCHCGKVAFRVEGELDRVLICNCTICKKKGYLHWVVPYAQFKLLTPLEDLATYCFNTKSARHHFCPSCGVAPFFVPRGRTDRIDVNVRCLENVDVSRLAVQYFDGADWEQSTREQDARAVRPW
jgi:hypothetical protein